MAGGTWQGQNKVLPGVYINIKTAPGNLYSVGERGVVTLCKPLSWGETEKPIIVEAGQDVTDILGFDANMADELLFLRQIFLGTNRTGGAKSVVLWRPAQTGAEKASVLFGTKDSGLTVTALHTGTRGNAISVAVTANPDAAGTFIVQTLLAGTVRDTQTIKEITSFVPNGWITLTGTLIAAAATALAGGTDGQAEETAYSTYLTAMESHPFDVLVYDGAEATVHAAITAFIKRLRETEGRKCQAVLAGYSQADYEGIISVENGVQLESGILTPEQTTWWVGGATAGASYNESLTFARHPLATGLVPRYTNTQMSQKIAAGGFVLMEENGEVRVACDCNSLTSLTPEHGKAFTKNRLIRTLDALARDVYTLYTTYYIGSADNDAFGRDLLKKEIIGYINELQAQRGVQNFVADDVSVAQGQEKDAVVITIAVQPTDAVEKIYIAVTVV